MIHTIIFNDVIERLKKSLKFNTDKELAAAIGMAENTFNGRKKAQSLPYKEIISLAAAEKLTLDWLFFGIYPTENNKNEFIKEDFSIYQVEKLKNYELIPIYNVEASAGYGALIDSEQICGELAFRSDWLSQKGLQVDKCALIKARGDSMEPTIADGDLLLVDLSVNSITDDAIYIVQLNAHLIVKRIQRRLHNAISILSDNPRYETQVLTVEQSADVKAIGRVRWYGHEI